MAFADVGRSMQAEVADLDEALGEEVLQESSDEVGWED
jgi:hypothetical protein